jgi:hypothetical protein
MFFIVNFSMDMILCKIYLSIYGSTALLFDHCRFFIFSIFCTVDRTPRTRDQPVARQIPTHETTQTQNKRTQTSIPRVGFEPTIPAFERAKTVHALGSAATMVGSVQFTIIFFNLYSGGWNQGPLDTAAT